MTDESSPAPSEAVSVSEIFKGSRLKINRARRHLSELESDVATFIRENPAHFNVHVPDTLVPDGDRLKLEVNVSFHIPPVPPELGPIIGDVVHNLRSSLDMMACELVRMNHQSDKAVYFPFCEKPEDLDKMIKERNFHRSGLAAVALLKTFEPHKGGNIALRALHDLAVQDKHHSLIPTAFSAATPILEIRDKDGNPIWPRIVGDPHTPSAMYVAFPGDGGIFACQEVVPTLHKLVELTAGIIESFALLVAHPASDAG